MLGLYLHVRGSECRRCSMHFACEAGGPTAGSLQLRTLLYIAEE